MNLKCDSNTVVCSVGVEDEAEPPHWNALKSADTTVMMHTQSTGSEQLESVSCKCLQDHSDHRASGSNSDGAVLPHLPSSAVLVKVSVHM